MVRSKAATVEQYLDELPEERRRVVEAVRQVILKNLPSGYEEMVNWGMLTYAVPLERYPDTHNKQPLCYVSLVAQKQHYALYLMGVYQDPDEATRLAEAFRKAGKKLDMGKSCLRFRRLEDLPLDAIGKLIAGTRPEEFIRRYEQCRGQARGKRRPLRSED